MTDKILINEWTLIFRRQVGDWSNYKLCRERKGKKNQSILLFLKNIDKQMEKFILIIYLIIWNNCENTLFLYALKMLRRVAQPGSALRSGRRGRWFESSRADRIKPLIFKGFFVFNE